MESCTWTCQRGAYLFVFNYFFIQPYYTFAVHQPTDVVILIIFLVVAIVISQLVGRARAGLAAANAREPEATQLFELRAALAGLSSDHTIVQILAQQFYTVAVGRYVEVNTFEKGPLHYQIPEELRPSRESELRTD